MTQNLTTDWNGTTIKFRALNDKTVTEDDDINVYTSDKHTIILIEGLSKSIKVENGCKTKTNNTKYTF